MTEDPAAGARSEGDSGPEWPPPFEIGGPVGSSWREYVLTRVAEQRSMLAWLVAQQSAPDPQALALQAAVVKHLDAARDAALGNPWFRGRLSAAISGASIERASGQLDAVECDLLRLATQSFRRGQLPSLLAHARRHLEPDDPRRITLEQLGTRERGEPWQKWEAEAVLAAVHAASSKARREIRQIRSFRNTLYATALVMMIAAVTIAVVGVRSPSSIPLCFNPSDMVVCPTSQASAPAQTTDQAEADRLMRTAARRWDVALIELLGLMAAALAAAFALRNIEGTSTPYSLPLALAVLKLPTGALTAVLALVLMRGEFIPGFSALDSSAQILAWAVVFGYAQQLFTQLVDRQAHSVLNNVRSGGTAPTANRKADAAAPSTPT